MGYFDFNKCCFCIDLRVGCLIIGYLSLVAEISLVIFYGLMVITGVALLVLNEYVLIAAVILFFLVLFLAFTIVLLVGIHQNKRGHVKVYMIYSIIFQVIFFILFLGSLVTNQNATDIMQDTAAVLLNLYFLLVIQRYYSKMEDNPQKDTLFYEARSICCHL